MQTKSIGLVRTVILSAAVLLPAATASLAEEFVNRGAAPPARYEVTHSQSAERAYGYTDPRASRYANGYYAYARAGLGYIADNEYLCQLSPGSVEHVPCDHY